MPKYDWYRRRWAVLERDRFTCRYCGQFAPNVMLHVDHVVPVSEGGTDDLDNLVVACAACNQGKNAYHAGDVVDGLANVRKVRRALTSKLARPTVSTVVLQWIAKQPNPVDKFEIMAATGYSDRAVSMALAELIPSGALQIVGKRSRKNLLSVPDDLPHAQS